MRTLTSSIYPTLHSNQYHAYSGYQSYTKISIDEIAVKTRSIISHKSHPKNSIDHPFHRLKTKQNLSSPGKPVSPTDARRHNAAINKPHLLLIIIFPARALTKKKRQVRGWTLPRGEQLAPAPIIIARVRINFARAHFFSPRATRRCAGTEYLHARGGLCLYRGRRVALFFFFRSLIWRW